MKISDQAVGAIMMALQKSLMEQTDIVPVIKGLDFVLSGEEEKELFIKNPPLVKFNEETSPYLEETETEDGE